MSLGSASLVALPVSYRSAETASAGGIELALQKLVHYGVTLHRLQVVETPDGWEATVILDV
jgi:SHS2 domain-containing protein